MDEIVKTSGLNFSYGTAPVIEDVSIEVKKGDYIGMIGYNGTGKSTLIKLLLGLLTARSGKIELFGKPLKSFSDWQRIGYLPQNLSVINPIFPATVSEIVGLGLLSTKRTPKRLTSEDAKLIHEALERLGIANFANQTLAELSGGQQQRVMLARSIVANPELLILDEPTNALDAETRGSFFSYLEEINRKHKTVIILITHDTSYVGDYANKLLYFDRKVVFYGSFEDFCQSSKMTEHFGPQEQHLICRRHPIV